MTDQTTPETAGPPQLTEEHAKAGRKLHTKLAQIMWEAERIPKNGRAPAAMGGYPFVQVGDAADMIRKALAEKQISMVPSHVERVSMVDRPTKNQGISITVDLLVTWTLTDGETGETATIMSYGAGADGGDKFSGKAMTSAMKYAFLSGFLLSTGEDTEGSTTPDLDSSDRGAAPAAPRAGRGRAPAQGGRQAAQTVPQKKMIGDLLRRAGQRTTAGSVELLQQLTGMTIELGDDKAASLSKWIDELPANTSGKLVHDLRKHVESLAQQNDQQAEHEENGTEPSNPSEPAGAPAPEDLEADEPAV